MTNWARAERELLCDLFLEVGPDAPTLCGTWTTRDLAAHLVVREHRPDTMPGLMISAFAGYSDRVRRRMASTEWNALVAKVRSGPPIWSPTRLRMVDELTNTIEFFVHHEDVRRASEPWEPRVLDPDLDTVLWNAVSRMGKLLARKAPSGLVLTDTSRPDRSATAKSGTPGVSVSGPAGELVLFVYGRQAHSRVGLVGDEADARAMMNAKFGV